MLYMAAKLIISAFLILAISEAGKRNAFLASMLASLPTISVLAMMWLYIDTKDPKEISNLSYGIFWLVLPSLSFFFFLPFLLKHKINFYIAMGLALALMFCCYFLMLALLKKFNIRI